MTHIGHRIERCECGIILAQCRCPSPDKAVVTVSPCTYGQQSPVVTYEWGTQTTSGATMAWISEAEARHQATKWDDRLVRRQIGPWEPVPSDTEQAEVGEPDV